MSFQDSKKQKSTSKLTKAVLFHIFLVSLGFYYVKFLSSKEYTINIEDIELNQLRTQRANESVKCYQDNFGEIDGKRLQEVLTAARQPKIGKTIFFHVTECNPSGLITLTPRQACAIESAAFNNPTVDVFVLFASPTYVPNNLDSSVIKALLKYKNIFLRNNNLWIYTEDTPAGGWFRGESIFRSDFLTTHLSEFMRLVTLWRYGGIYVNLDVLVLDDLYYFPPNTIGALDNSTVGNAVINVDDGGESHNVVATILKHFVENFKGDSLEHNGAQQITTVLKEKICKVNDTQSMTAEQCWGMDVYPSRTYYPIEKENARYLFEEEHISEAMEVTYFTLTVRLWDEVTKDSKYKVGSVSALGLHAYSNCPRIYKSAGAYL
ncbi:hypothetical protein ACFFRR_003846 [Megaselia abdita]